jgi:hypothetical protein
MEQLQQGSVDWGVPEMAKQDTVDARLQDDVIIASQVANLQAASVML